MKSYLSELTARYIEITMRGIFLCVDVVNQRQAKTCFLSCWFGDHAGLKIVVMMFCQTSFPRSSIIKSEFYYLFFSPD